MRSTRVQGPALKPFSPEHPTARSLLSYCARSSCYVGRTAAAAAVVISWWYAIIRLPGKGLCTVVYGIQSSTSVRGQKHDVIRVSFTVTTPRRSGTPHVTPGSMADRIIKRITYCARARAQTTERLLYVHTHNTILHALTYNRNRPDRLCVYSV